MLIQVEQIIPANRGRRFSVADTETDSLAPQKGLPSAKKFSNSVAFGFNKILVVSLYCQKIEFCNNF